jgi:hypothetical protein
VTTSGFGRLLYDMEKHEHPGPAPDPACDCGIYSRRPDRSDDLWVTRIDGLPRVGGFVEMSGIVIEGSKGYRAQWARIVGPLEVWVPCGDCGESAETVTAEEGRFRGSCRDHRRAGVTATVGAWFGTVIPLLGQRYGLPIIESERN